MDPSTRRCWIIAGLCLAFVLPALAWHGDGHYRATELAIDVASSQLPEFFVAGAKTVAHCSLDPDVFTLRSLTHSRDGTYGDHYMDLEWLGGEAIPPTRSALIKWCGAKGIEPQKVGMLPYALAEATEKLTAAFAEHRKWPDNPHIKIKCLVYAGQVAHLAQDLCQPLHTTIHYNGRADEKGVSPGTGIHHKVDSLIGKMQATPAELTGKLTAEPLAELMPAILAELGRSQALVERVYELEDELPGTGEPIQPDSQVAKFAAERTRVTVQFAACVFATAWSNSATLQLDRYDVEDRLKTEKIAAPVP